MKVAVLGGGSIGVASAWWLQQAGFKVSVIDRQPQVGLETSRNCGGLISIGQARPWAQPDAPWALFKSLFSDFAPLRLRLQLEPKQWAWLASFVHQSMPRKNRANIFALVRLAEYSRNLLHDLSQELSINYQKRNCGVLSVYRDHKALAQAEHILDRLRDLGIERRLLSPAEVIAVEPSLAHKEHEIIGGDYTSKDSVGDAYLFARALAKHAGKEGVNFLFNTTITRLICRQGKVVAVEVLNSNGEYEELQFDLYVIALGAYSGLLLEQTGLSYPLYPIKGYSALFPIMVDRRVPEVGVYDPQLRLSIARFGDQLKVSGLAELVGFSRAINKFRSQKLVQQAQRYCQDAINTKAVRFWSGLRSATPSSVPLIGRSKIKNLYLNTGHGNLGWTMAVGGGRILADLMQFEHPKLDFPYLK